VVGVAQATWVIPPHLVVSFSQQFPLQFVVDTTEEVQYNSFFLYPAKQADANGAAEQGVRALQQSTFFVVNVVPAFDVSQ
jgi:hypothetical protein